MFKKGKENINWDNDKSEYKNHSEFKRNRLIKLKEKNYKCEVCGKDANYVHHRDFSKDNHILLNLMAVCYPCHFNIHFPDRLVKQHAKLCSVYQNLKLRYETLRNIHRNYRSRKINKRRDSESFYRKKYGRYYRNHYKRFYKKLYKQFRDEMEAKLK